MPRLVVFGNPGAGKSTFARRIADILKLPYISLDAHYWKPGWVESNHAAFRERVSPLLEQDHYVLDGNYFTPLGEGRMVLADHIFWFDMPAQVCTSGVLRRVLTGLGTVRPEMAAGCPERLSLEFLRFVWNYPGRNRNKFAEMIERNGAAAKVTRCTRRKEADALLARIAHEGLA